LSVCFPSTDCFEQEKKKNLTREERKLEAIMKAFEKMEKDEKRKRETSCSGKCSGGASPEGEEKKSSGRGRKIGQMGRKKPGRK
jgi:histone-lysine N-methyltransferase MLL5